MICCISWKWRASFPSCKWEDHITIYHTGPLNPVVSSLSPTVYFFRRVRSREVFVSSAVCERTVSWISRGKQTGTARPGVDICLQSTIGAAFLTQTVCLDDTTVKFEIWDTAGQERYHSLAPMYYRGAQAAIVVYDITNADTFERAKSWVKELQRQVEILFRSDWWLIATFPGQSKHSHRSSRK